MYVEEFPLTELIISIGVVKYLNSLLTTFIWNLTGINMYLSCLLVLELEQDLKHFSTMKSMLLNDKSSTTEPLSNSISL